ncbi:hypothetical protein J7I98_26845 [Streptomyces sp. ISL-98]|uniref:hypothetical protein n=1 Tax=Streptomyces sp. ISL-98 TaxID=2819192 RepID=UPI001BE99129|nr:hypothetical protein [Streptomyces sp. ISL-98]MBT2509432.1 hypothetical protein [Streptomyces sp. ISL-98]
MNHRTEQPKLPLIAVHPQTAANAQLRLGSLLASAGASAGEVQYLVAAIQAGAVEAAQGEAIELDTPPGGRGEQFEEGWLAAVQAVTSRLAHIADRTLQQAPADTPDPPHRTSTRSRRKPSGELALTHGRAPDRATNPGSGPWCLRSVPAGV